jgi:copper(I)-binding protein
MNRLRQIALALAVACVGSSVAGADEIKAGDLVLTQAWSRATPKGAKTGAGYGPAGASGMGGKMDMKKMPDHPGMKM